jgi:hypothetical protein
VPLDMSKPHRGKVAVGKKRGRVPVITGDE